jgi:hypothetical protein
MMGTQMVGKMDGGVAGGGQARRVGRNALGKSKVS